MSNKSKITELHRFISSVNPAYKFFINISPLELLLKNVKEGSKMITYGLKDNISTKDHPLTCSSKILKGYNPNYDSTVSRILKEQNNWINLGKLNLDEFGMGSGGVHSDTGCVINPVYTPLSANKVSSEAFYDSQIRVTGGSSSGSAAICAAKVPSADTTSFERLAHFALGTDTGGSVRLPAAWCNVSSFKPSYGCISRFGVLPYAHSLDTIGIISSDLNVIRQVYKVLNQYDSNDPTSMSKSLRSKIECFDSSTTNDTISIGLIQQFNIKGISTETNKVYSKFLESILEMKNDFELKSISIESISNALPIYFTLAPAEAASNLARFDGLRYGADGVASASSDPEKDGMFVRARSLFGDEVQKRILLGNYNLSSDLYDNKYKKAQVLRTELINEFNSAFKDTHPIYPINNHQSSDKIDVFISLTSTNKAPLLSEFLKANSSSPLEEFCNDIFTIPMSLAGLPVVSIPIKDTGVSIQITGQYGYDEKVLNIAQKIKNMLLSSK